MYARSLYRSFSSNFVNPNRPTLLVVLGTIAFFAAGAKAQPSEIVLQTVVRDFRASNTSGGHPDFERANFTSGVHTGMLAATLPANRVPEYMGTNGHGDVANASSFAQWYADVPDVNARIPNTSLTLAQLPNGNYRYENADFFPIDGLGFGNQGNSHNYHFTMSIAASFQYDASASQILTYSGDDDLWAFVNGQLVIDLGGIHGVASRTIDMQSLATTLGLVDRQTYPLDIYFAERHTINSTILIETSFPIPAPSTAAFFGLGGLIVARRRR